MNKAKKAHKRYDIPPSVKMKKATRARRPHLDEIEDKDVVSSLSSSAESQSHMQAYPFLPLEVWCMILEHLKDDIGTMLNCRYVDRMLKKAVDKVLDDKSKGLKNELNSLPKRKTRIGEPVYRTRITNPTSLDRFLKEMESKEVDVNPFVTGWLNVGSRRWRRIDKPKYEYRIWELFDHSVYSERFCELAEKFGEKVYRLEFTMMGYHGLMQFTQNVFPNFPNLREIDIEMAIPYWRKINRHFSSRMPEIIESVNFSPLPHLHTLKLRMDTDFEESLAAQILKNYGNQIQTLVVVALESTGSKFFEMISPDMVPNVTNLQIKAVPIPLTYQSEEDDDLAVGIDQQPLLKFLKSGKWALKQFSLHFEGDGFLTHFQIEDVHEIVSQHSETLEILHLYFNKDKKSHKYERFFSLPHSVSKKSKPHFDSPLPKPDLKFPLLKKFGLSQGYFVSRELVCQICRKFENLRTIYLCAEKVDITPSRFKKDLAYPGYGNRYNNYDFRLSKVIRHTGNQFDNNVAVFQVLSIKAKCISSVHQPW